ncbi:hypothetical protein L596_001422 [Steinernema carpocapsae]|uniref:Actin-related protein 6 n=1 Tax=Steinernema carpocapsae TaxID=34508 RepID=A0A4U8ULE3_STECR|nr:hypothetical protein L596_001422 [Steinernema carpocapsae]
MYADDARSEENGRSEETMSRMLILDNGAWTLKAGYTWEPKPSVQCPNAVIRSKTTSRIWDAADFHMCRDRSNLFIHSPFQKGYLVDWTIEHPVWQSVFEKLVVDPDETKLVLSDPNMMVPALKQVHIRDEILFEDFEFSAVHKTSGPLCVGYPGIQVGDHVNDTMCTLVVDSGYSFTHVVPIINGEVIFSGVKRMTVGGKHLTNQLLDWITYRQMDMREETFLMNQLKEDVCYVAENFEKDMANMNKPAQKKEMERDFYLPDNRTWFAGRDS